MAVHVWEQEPQLLQIVARMHFMDLFRATGGDTERAGIFSLLVQDPQLTQFMMDSKRDIMQHVCWNVQERLFSKITDVLSVTGKDTNGAAGIVCLCFLLLVNQLKYPYFTARSSVRTVDCQLQRKQEHCKANNCTAQ